MAKTKLPTPTGNKLLMEIKETTAGAIGIEQGAQIQEMGKILAMGSYVDAHEFKVGDMLHFKAWAVDIVAVDKEKFYYLSANSDAICGKV